MDRRPVSKGDRGSVGTISLNGDSLFAEMNHMGRDMLEQSRLQFGAMHARKLMAAIRDVVVNILTEQLASLPVPGPHQWPKSKPQRDCLLTRRSSVCHLDSASQPRP